MHAVVMMVVMAAAIMVAVHPVVMAAHVPAMMPDEAPVTGAVGRLGGASLRRGDLRRDRDRGGLGLLRRDSEGDTRDRERHCENLRYDHLETRTHRNLLLKHGLNPTAAQGEVRTPHRWPTQICWHYSRSWCVF